MWYKNILTVSIVLLFLLAAVAGSCLEYGHSCWGAHGKRSGGTILRTATDLNNAQLTRNIENAETAHEKNLFENFANGGERITLDKNDDTDNAASGKQFHANKLRRLLRKRHPEFVAHNTLRAESAERSQFNNNQPLAERWPGVPIFKLKKYFTKHSAQPTETNELYQQTAHRSSVSRNDDEDGAYFDYK